MNLTSEEEEEEPVIPPSDVQFWTFLAFQIPSLLCTIFLLYQLFRQRKLRHGLHNHVIIILLLLVLGIEVFDNPLYIDAYRFGGTANSFPMTKSICLMWWIFDYGFYGAITVYLAWGAIERHLLVFHQHRFLRTKKQRFYLHYVPLFLLTIYVFGFYLGVIVFPPCETTFDFESLACGLSPCYEENPILYVWDYLINGIVCTFLETFFSLALLIRVLMQKRRLQQTTNRKKYHKMAFQLLSVSFLSLTIVFPQSLIIVIKQFGWISDDAIGTPLDSYFFFLYSFVVFLLPFICLLNFPELWPKLRIFQRKTRVSAGVLAQVENYNQSLTRAM